MDNVFYDEQSDTFNPIDFDDAVYHWFIMDVEQSLNNLREDLPIERYGRATEEFTGCTGMSIGLPMMNGWNCLTNLKPESG